MEIYIVFIVIIAAFAIGSFLALPWIWYHAGHASRKLSRIIELLEQEKRTSKISGEGVNRNIFKYHSKDAKGINKDGVIEALDREDATKKLQEQGLIIFSLEKLTGEINE